MTFTEWLSKLGEVIVSCVGWMGDTINALKDNYIILTIIGIAMFSLVIDIIIMLINIISMATTGKYLIKDKRKYNIDEDK